MLADTAEKSKSTARYKPNGVESTNPQRLIKAVIRLADKEVVSFFPMMD